ncbi:MAG TPA: flavodoxin domain-containing protein [Mycobacteriales bacterium]|nr:flavodoxin domain-containing protein [Mycobacteriales bacterium]
MTDDHDVDAEPHSLLSDGIYLHRFGCSALAGLPAFPVSSDNQMYWDAVPCSHCRPDLVATGRVDVKGSRPNRQPRILLVYVTRRGQTQKIAERVASRLRSAGASVDIRTLPGCPGPEGYDAVVVGGPVYFSRHSRGLTRYLARHADQLDGIPTGIFQVSLTSAVVDDAHTAHAAALLRNLLARTDFEPGVVGTFAGALRFSRYNRILRRVMFSIARQEKLPVHDYTDQEYTDWDGVDRFCDQMWGAIAATRAN